MTQPVAPVRHRTVKAHTFPSRGRPSRQRTSLRCSRFESESVNTAGTALAQQMHQPAKARLGRVRCRPRRPPGSSDDDRMYVQSRRQLDPYHRDTCIRQKWLLCHLVNSSAREPTTDVPSCDKPAGAAWKRRTQDIRMGIPTAIASRNRERRELKHLSTGRNRTQPRYRQ